MNKIAQYYKALAAFLLAGLGATATALADGHITSLEWVGIGIAVIGAPTAVGIVTNAPSPSVTSALAGRVSGLEDQVVTAPDMANAVSQGVVSGLQHLGHLTDSPPPRDELHAAAQPDPVDETPASVLDGLEAVDVTAPVAAATVEPVLRPSPTQRRDAAGHFVSD